jgi:hypothetical protein
MTINIYTLLFIITISFISGASVALLFIWLKNKKELSKIELFYSNILKNIKSMEFLNRLGSNIQFIINDFILLYNLDKKELSIFKEDKCIATSDYINKKLISDIIDFIELNFKKEIYEDIINVSGYLISKNYMENVEYYYIEDENDIDGEDDDYDEEDDSPKELNLDDILDKISKKGIESLSKAENDFLTKYKK